MKTRYSDGNLNRQLYTLCIHKYYSGFYHYAAEGCLQSMDWTSGLDWWTDAKNHFLHFLMRLTCLYGVVWNPAAFSVAILWSWSK